MSLGSNIRLNPISLLQTWTRYRLIFKMNVLQFNNSCRAVNQNYSHACDSVSRVAEFLQRGYQLIRVLCSQTHSHHIWIPKVDKDHSLLAGQVVCFGEHRDRWDLYKIMIVLKLQTRTRRSSSLPKGAKHLLGQKQTADLHFTTNKAKNFAFLMPEKAFRTVRVDLNYRLFAASQHSMSMCNFFSPALCHFL